MAVNTSWSSTWNNASDPLFRSWAGLLSQALFDVGMVPVERSSVASAWGTVIGGFVGTTTNTEWAWEVWRFPDSPEQTAAPVFIRIGYGTGSSQCPNITIRVSATAGTGGNAPGIGGSDKIAVTVGSIQATWATPWLLSCDGHGLALFANSTYTSNSACGTLLVIDRVRDPEGDPHTGYALAMLHSYSGRNSVTQNVFDLVSGEWVSTTWGGGAPCITQSGLSTVTTNLNGNGETQVYPWIFVTKNAQGFSKMIATYSLNDMIALSTQAVRWLPSIGTPADRTLKGLGAWMAGSWDYVGSSVSPGASLAMWWSDP